MKIVYYRMISFCLSLQSGVCSCIYGNDVFQQLYCPIGISPMGNSGHFPKVHAGCFSVFRIHQTLDVDYKIINVHK